MCDDHDDRYPSDTSEEALGRLLTMDSDLVVSWINHVECARPDLAETFNWLGLAAAVRNRPLLGADGAEPNAGLGWADVWLRSMQRATSVGTLTPEYVARGELALRCGLVLHRGCHPEVPWLDPRSIIRIFVDLLDISWSEAEAIPEDRRAMTRADLLRLRRVKNMLTQMAPVRGHLAAPDLLSSAELDRWFALRPALP